MSHASMLNVCIIIYAYTCDVYTFVSFLTLVITCLPSRIARCFKCDSTLHVILYNMFSI